ncbi:hypothetical protein VP01_119g3 [Puccinia sorghi]|uniref:Uncharacterized protein n=1 Tax=Puccinia sorghi TaxID=27349 RepID=A0A0L6VQS4_9BASI|nr:hypothetical protein VP01_119g3 [Puccinia sorghi]
MTCEKREGKEQGLAALAHPKDALSSPSTPIPLQSPDTTNSCLPVPKVKLAVVSLEIKAAAAGHKLGSKLQKAVNSPMGILPSSAKLSGSATLPNCFSVHLAVGSTDTEETKGFFTKSKWETNTELVSDNITHRLLNNVKSDNSKSTLSVTTPLWLTYCLVL